MKRLWPVLPLTALALFGLLSLDLFSVSAAPAPKPPKTISNSIGMKFAYIPPGKFKMGSTEAEQKEMTKVEGLKKKPTWLEEGEKEHEVEITKGFYLGVYEVTQKQFREVMGYNPSYFSKDGKKRDSVAKYGEYCSPAEGKKKVAGLNTDDFPVENVSWEEAQEFITKLNGLAKEKEQGWKYRLPTEAEWEYSCRGGAVKKTTFHYGDSFSSSQANFDGNYPFGGAKKGPNLERTRKVGSYKPNGFGLYDMHGNVWELCQDTWDDDYYAHSPKRNPLNTAEGRDRLMRGGCWNGFGWLCRSAVRFGCDPKTRSSGIGFRVALVPAR
jgi:formylglycine-generating enzyme required for sulfatase activity